MAATADGQTWVLAYEYGSGFVVGNSSSWTAYHFGGRPNRFSRPGALPTELIDVYGLDGRYRRSYQLPRDTPALVTDGHIYYVLTRTLDGLPTILALVPRASS